MPHTKIQPLYESLAGKTIGAGEKDLMGDDMSKRLLALAAACKAFITTIEIRELESKVTGKKYFMFVDTARSKTSRPVNAALYMDDLDQNMMLAVLNCQFGKLKPNEITRIVYTIAMLYCASADILKTSDQKTPGTFFEFLIGHLVSRSLKVNPERQITVPTLDVQVTLPTDFVFDLGPNKNRVHLPIKLSTRERVVQVWAHQRVLDGMHGVARFKGVLVAMAETNKQKETSVVEVCLPNQWIAYQMYIAQLFRVYYLDLPDKYVALKSTYPFIQVREFGEFFFEINKIEKSGVG